MNLNAITALYPSVVTINGSTAYDANGEVVDMDMAALQSWADAEAYKEQRSRAYPSIQDQLDQIYHEGIDAWKATIAAVKQEYTKP